MGFNSNSTTAPTCADPMDLRQATPADRDAIDTVISAAVMTDAGEIVGVAALETLAPPENCPSGRHTELLHGLHVRPDRQHQGIGTQLWQAARAHAQTGGACGLLVRAQADSVGFFSAMGMQEQATIDARRDYPHQFWLPLNP